MRQLSKNHIQTAFRMARLDGTYIYYGGRPKHVEGQRASSGIGIQQDVASRLFLFSGLLRQLWARRAAGASFA